MVDQLWMWVLPAYGPLPAMIITAFPQRNKREEGAQLPELVTNILERCSELHSWSSFQVAQIIAAECSRIYFDFTSNRNQLVQFLNVYRTSISSIVSGHRLCPIYYA